MTTPSIINVTNIPAPRVPLIDQRTGFVSREWFAFFSNIFTLTGSGQVSPVDATLDTSLDDSVLTWISGE